MNRTDKIQDSCTVSIRLKQCSKAARIETFKDLLSLPKEELLKRYNFGHRTTAEIDEIRKFQLNQR